jgi:hypothetical protein
MKPNFNLTHSTKHRKTQALRLGVPYHHASSTNLPSSRVLISNLLYLLFVAPQRTSLRPNPQSILNATVAAVSCFDYCSKAKGKRSQSHRLEDIINSTVIATNDKAFELKVFWRKPQLNQHEILDIKLEKGRRRGTRRQQPRRNWCSSSLHRQQRRCCSD